MTRVGLCGGLEVDLGGERVEDRLPGRQGRLLFAFLVLSRDRPVPRDALIDLLWPEGAPPSADTALSALLSRLRKGLGPDVIDGRSEVRLALPEPVHVDVEQAAAGEAAEAVAILSRPFLPGVEGPWADEQRDRDRAEEVADQARESGLHTA